MKLPISAELQAKIMSVMPRLLAGVANGDRITSMLQTEGLTFENMRAFWSHHPEVRRAWDDARTESAYAFEELARDAIESDELDPKDKRARADFYMRAAAKRHPRVYGDSARLDVNVKTVDLTRIIERANARLGMRAPVTIEHDQPALAYNSGEQASRARALGLDLAAVTQRALADLL